MLVVLASNFAALLSKPWCSTWAFTPAPFFVGTFVAFPDRRLDEASTPADILEELISFGCNVELILQVSQVVCEDVRSPISGLIQGKHLLRVTEGHDLSDSGMALGFLHDGGEVFLGEFVIN